MIDILTIENWINNTLRDVLVSEFADWRLIDVVISEALLQAGAVSVVRGLIKPGDVAEVAFFITGKSGVTVRAALASTGVNAGARRYWVSSASSNSPKVCVDAF